MRIQLARMAVTKTTESAVEDSDGDIRVPDDVTDESSEE